MLKLLISELEDLGFRVEFIKNAPLDTVFFKGNVVVLPQLSTSIPTSEIVDTLRKIILIAKTLGVEEISSEIVFKGVEPIIEHRITTPNGEIRVNSIGAKGRIIAEYSKVKQVLNALGWYRDVEVPFDETDVVEAVIGYNPMTMSGVIVSKDNIKLFFGDDPVKMVIRSNDRTKKLLKDLGVSEVYDGVKYEFLWLDDKWTQEKEYIAIGHTVVCLETHNDDISVDNVVGALSKFTNAVFYIEEIDNDTIDKLLPVIEAIYSLGHREIEIENTEVRWQGGKVRLDFTLGHVAYEISSFEHFKVVETAYETIENNSPITILQSTIYKRKDIRSRILETVKKLSLLAFAMGYSVSNYLHDVIVVDAYDVGIASESKVVFFDDFLLLQRGDVQTFISFLDAYTIKNAIPTMAVLSLNPLKTVFRSDGSEYLFYNVAGVHFAIDSEGNIVELLVFDPDERSGFKVRGNFGEAVFTNREIPSVVRVEKVIGIYKNWREDY